MQWSSFGKGEVTRRIWANMIGQRTRIGHARSDDLLRTERHVRRLFERFNSKQPLEFYDWIDRFQLDVTTDIFFGESADFII